MLIYWFLPMIFVLGVVTSYEDIKFGKIRNKWIILALSYSIVINLVLLSLNYYSRHYIVNLLIDALLALVVGFLIWLVHLWTAGDAKLFFAFAALSPAISAHYYAFLINLLSNIFIPISIYLLLHLLFKANYKKSVFHLKKTFAFEAIYSLIFFIFGISWVVKEILNLLGIRSNIFLVFLFSFLLFYLAERIIKIEIVFLSLGLSVLRLLVDNSVYSIKFGLEFLILIFMFLLLRIFLVSLSSEYFTEKLKFNELKAGMIPAENIFEDKGRFFKKPVPFSITGMARDNKMGISIFRNFGKGIDKEDVKRLNILQKKLPFKTLKVQITMPFAPFIFLGVLLTIVFPDGIFHAMTFALSNWLWHG